MDARITTITGPEATILNAPDRIIVPRVQIQNASGTWKTLSSLSGTGFTNLDFVLGLGWGKSIDDPTWTGTVTLATSIKISPSTAISIATYMETSPANVDDASAPAPLIEGMRRIRWYTTTKNINGDAATEHKVFDGYVVEVDNGEYETTLQVSDLGHKLVITQIEDDRIYPAGMLLEEAIQQILDDTLGTGVITLVVDPDIAGQVELSTPFNPGRPRLMEAIRTLALETVGANVCYLWNGDDMELTLFMPPRTKTTPDFTYAKNRMYPSTNFTEKTDDVRNVGTIKFKDGEKKQVVSLTYTVPASVTKYGRRYFEFVFSSTGQITNEADAERFIQNAIDDLAQPKAEKKYSAPYNWAAEPWDLYTLTANDIHYSSDQQQAVSRVSHSLTTGDQTSSFETRGNIAGFSRRWIKIEGRGSEPLPEDFMASFGTAFFEGSMYGGELFNGLVDGCIWLLIYWGFTMKRLHIWARNNDATALVLQWPPPSSEIYKAVTLDRPDGNQPLQGNYVRPVDGRLVWEMMVPIPTTPGIKRTFIIQTEAPDGTLGPFTKTGPFTAVDPMSTAEPGNVLGASVTRPDATTIHLEWSRDVPFTPGYFAIMQDNICIQRLQTAGGGPFTLDIEDLNPDTAYRIGIVPFNAGITGGRYIADVPAWTTGFTFPDPDFITVSGAPRVRLQVPSGTPVGTTLIRIQKSRDALKDRWTTVTKIATGDFPYYDAVVMAGAFYRYQALDSGGAILDTTLTKYWSSPL